MWQKDININEVKELRLKTNVYFGVGAIEKVDDVVKDMASKNIKKVIVVSGRGAYKITGAWDYVEKALKSYGVEYVNFDRVAPNPTTHQVDEAAKMAIDFGAEAVIAIGGGSSIDAGKSTAILMKHPGKTCTELYEYAFSPSEAAPILAINLTHGTGTEVNRFAVVTVPEKDFKPAIAYDCIYPTWSIDDPKLMTKLSPNQTIYVSVDAVNHVVEAATSLCASPLAITMAKETIRFVAKYLPVALKDPDNLEARYFLAYAALLGGASFDNGLLHYTHALEHPLSALKHELSHGLGLAMLLPAVVKNIYASKAETLAEIFEPIVPGLKATADEAEFCAIQIENWLASVGISQKLEDEGFSSSDIDRLVELTFTTPSLGGLLEIAPTKATKEVVAQIYQDSLVSMSKAKVAN